MKLVSFIIFSMHALCLRALISIYWSQLQPDYATLSVYFLEYCKRSTQIKQSQHIQPIDLINIYLNAIKTIKSSNVLFIDPLKSIQLRTNLQQMTNTQTLGAFQADTMKISEQFNCFFLLESVLKILVQMYMVNVILASFERSAEIGRYSLRLWCVLNGYASQLTDRNKRTVYFS